MKRLALLASLVLASVPAIAPASAQAPATFDQLKRADGAKVVPDRFLRSWDPITLFFDEDKGPTAGGPEDHPERFVTMQPAAPGAWQWLNGRTLQFRPADPWRELTPVEISGPQISAKLIPLLATPESTSPEENAEPVTDLNRIVLTFAAPVDINALSRLTSIAPKIM